MNAHGGKREGSGRQSGKGTKETALDAALATTENNKNEITTTENNKNEIMQLLRTKEGVILTTLLLDNEDTEYEDIINAQGLDRHGIGYRHNITPILNTKLRSHGCHPLLPTPAITTRIGPHPSCTHFSPHMQTIHF
jgi:hypothetical protein